jgi:hypothetical protein
MKLFGFKDFARMIGNIAHDIEQISREPLRQLGLKGERLAKEHLQNQDLNWTPLNVHYLKRKQNTGKGKRRLSEKTLIATGSYFHSITSYTTARTVAIGVLRGVRNADGVEIANIARIHEYGSKKRNIPARPLWSVVRNELSNDTATRLSFLRAARIYIKRKYGI